MARKPFFPKPRTSLPDPDWPDIEKALQGDRDAFGKLIERHRQKLYQEAFRYLKDEDEANDAVSESSIKAFEKFDTYNPNKGKFISWMLKIVKNTCLDQIRYSQRFELYEEEDHTLENHQEMKFFDEGRVNYGKDPMDLAIHKEEARKAKKIEKIEKEKDISNKTILLKYSQTFPTDWRKYLKKTMEEKHQDIFSDAVQLINKRDEIGDNLENAIHSLMGAIGIVPRSRRRRESLPEQIVSLRRLDACINMLGNAIHAGFLVKRMHLPQRQAEKLSSRQMATALRRAAKELGPFFSQTWTDTTMRGANIYASVPKGRPKLYRERTYLKILRDTLKFKRPVYDAISSLMRVFFPQSKWKTKDVRTILSRLPKT